MNYIREAEARLWHYRDLKRSLDSMDRDIHRLTMAFAPAGYPQPALDGMPHDSNRGIEIENVAFELGVIQQARAETLREIEAIDAVLAALENEPGCELYPVILRLWYIDRMPKEQIAELLNYSPNSRHSIYDLKSRAIRKFAVNLFGIKALEAI